MNARTFAALAFALVGCSAPVALPSSPAPVAAEAPDAGPPSAAPANDARPGVYDGGGPAQWSEDAGWLEPVYDVARSVDVTEKSAIVVACNEGDALVASASGCAVNGGELVVSERLGNGWACSGAPAPAKVATIIVWVQCHRAAK